MHGRDGQSFGAQPGYRLLDCAHRAAPAHQQQVTTLVGTAAENRRWLERLLQRGELQAASAQCLLVDLRVVGHLAGAIVRQAGEGVHSPGLAGLKAPRQAGDGIPVIGLAARRHRGLVDWRRKPVLAELRPREGLLRCGQTGVGQHHHHHAEGLGDLARGDH